MITFPITSNVVPPGSDRTIRKELNKGDFVHCWWCKEPFLVDEFTVKITDKYENKALRCPVCGKLVSVLYYYDSAHKATRRERNLIAQRRKRRKDKYRD